MRKEKVTPCVTVLKRVRSPLVDGVKFLCARDYCDKETDLAFVTQKDLVNWIDHGVVKNASVVKRDGSCFVRLLDRTHEPLAKDRWDNGPFMILTQLYPLEEKFWNSVAERIQQSGPVQVGSLGKPYIDICHRSIQSAIWSELRWLGIRFDLPADVMAAIACDVLQAILADNMQIMSIDFGTLGHSKYSRAMYMTLNYYRLSLIVKQVLLKFKYENFVDFVVEHKGTVKGW